MRGPWPGHPSAATASSVVLGGWPARARRPLRCWRARGLISILRNHQGESSEARITRRRGRKLRDYELGRHHLRTCGRRTTERRSSVEGRTLQDRGQPTSTTTHHCLCVQLLHCIDTAQHASDAALATTLRHARQSCNTALARNISLCTLSPIRFK